MDEKWYWIELIGFDRAQPDYGVKDFISRVSGNIRGVSLLLYSIDFINMYDGFRGEEPLLRSVCSYGGHPFNEERAVQPWTGADLKGLVEELHRNGAEVLLSVFDLYTYTDGEGKTQDSAFLQEHPEVRAFCSAKFRAEDAVFVMKRLKDGSAYRDYFIHKLAAALADYGFDGFHLADGLSSPRYCIQSGDFSDDIVEQYIKATGARLPERLRGGCDGSRKRHMERYRYIMGRQRYAFTCFVAEWFADFYKRLAATLRPLNKKIIFNIAWTRDPLEALFRYGIDYARLETEGISGMMIEDVGSSLPLLSPAGLGGFAVPVEQRKYANHAFFLTQLAIKAHVPGLRQFNMTPLKDTQEDWNMIDAAPYEVQKMIVRRRNTWLTTKKGFRRVSEGAFYCLSDGMSKEKWDIISGWESFAGLPDIKGVMGFTAVWEPEALYRELERLIDERKPSGKHLLEMLAVAGIPVSSMVRSGELAACKTPLLAANAELFPAKTRRRLEWFFAAPMVLVGYANPLERETDAILSEGENGLCFYFYNCPQLKGEIIQMDFKKKTFSNDFRDAHGGIWTAELAYDRPKAAFMRQARKRMDSLGLYPVVANGADCRITAYVTGECSALLLISNDSFASEDAEVHFPYPIKTVRSLNKPEWYCVPHRGGKFSIHMNNRALEVLEVAWESRTGLEKYQREEM